MNRRTKNIEKKYKKVFSNKKFAESNRKLAEEFLPVVKKTWPKY